MPNQQILVRDETAIQQSGATAQVVFGPTVEAEKTTAIGLSAGREPLGGIDLSVPED